MKYAIILVTVVYLSFVGQISVSAQGIVGSEMPKEILGRADSAEEIVALNTEIDRRRTLAFIAMVSALGSMSFAIYYLRRRQRKVKMTSSPRV